MPKMERGTSHQPFQPEAGSDHRATGTTPRRVRSRSQGQNDTKRRKIQGAEGANGRIPRRLSHLRATSYTAHLRSSSRTSWDGTALRPNSRTPSPSPPTSPVRRSHQPRPLSIVSLPDYAFEYGRPSVLADRWSYDRERMPSPSPAPRPSRPGTPVSEYEHEGREPGYFSSRPASTFIESRPSTPTLMLTPPPPSDYEGESLPQQQGRRKRQSYHLLTSEELEILSHPPPAQSPMSAAARSRPTSPAASPSTPEPNMKLTSEVSRLGPPIATPRREHAAHGPHDDEEKDKPSCLGLCEVSTAKNIVLTFGGWFMGIVIPVTSGLVTGCVAAATGCR